MTDREFACTVNGTKVARRDVPDDERLLDTLRWRLGRKGTKEGCRTGDCGACTVLVGGRPTLACLTLSHEVAGESVVTVEGLHDDPVGRRVQEAFERESALQCGYCTPGFLVALTGAIKSHPHGAGERALLEAIGGNLCRCTGYVAIRRAVASLGTSRP
ncbi:MAG: 2Fe-2S iron-sulfur cluster-binding protein [Thermoplasmata archaeon]|nr:2Fe-2S iron-sulfur cluster-binding protein [Thermoplasmata archaeon]